MFMEDPFCLQERFVNVYPGGRPRLRILTIYKLSWGPDYPLGQVQAASELYSLTDQAGARLVLHLTRHHEAGGYTERTEDHLQVVVVIHSGNHCSGH